jgi:hypothetical protein
MIIAHFLSLKFNCNVAFPGAFQAILAPLNILNLNIVPALGFACRIKDFDYIDTLVGITLAPLAFAAFLCLLYILQTANRKLKEKSAQKLVEKHAQYAIPEELISVFSKSEVATFRRAFAFFDTDLRGNVDGSLFALSKEHPVLSFVDFMYAVQRSRQEGCETELLLLVNAAEAKANQQKGDSMFFLLLLFSFVILIGTSSTVFEYFQCVYFEEAEPAMSYLARDYSLDCASPRYRSYVAYAVAMLLVYPLG